MSVHTIVCSTGVVGRKGGCSSSQISLITTSTAPARVQRYCSGGNSSFSLETTISSNSSSATLRRSSTPRECGCVARCDRSPTPASSAMISGTGTSARYARGGASRPGPICSTVFSTTSPRSPAGLRAAHWSAGERHASRSISSRASISAVCSAMSAHARGEPHAQLLSTRRTAPRRSYAESSSSPAIAAGWSNWSNPASFFSPTPSPSPPGARSPAGGGRAGRKSARRAARAAGRSGERASMIRWALRALRKASWDSASHA
mmetsp:Transcript_46274/g.105453  ORF Transcript_46274/g.105453 Transcript_46274/m.105453 type:complete len:262 (-) Transcript_46274:258-1043(-)